MRWWPRRCTRTPLPSGEDLAERCAEAARAREETARQRERIAARAPQVAAVASTWRTLSQANHYGDTITAALRGRET